MKTVKISNGLIKAWTVRQIKDFNRATGLCIKLVDSAVKEQSELTGAYMDTGVYYLVHERGVTIQNEKFVLNVNNNGTTSILNIGKGYVGFSKCNKKDDYNYWLGIAIAWARYKGEKLPEFSVKVKDLKIGDKFKHNNGVYELLAINHYKKSAVKYLCVLTAIAGVTVWSVGDIMYLEGNHRVILSNI